MLPVHDEPVSETRSRIMRSVRQKDTKPEMMLRCAIHARGLRYRLHVSDLPGSPDLVFPKYKAVVFVHGCFWHRHPGCPKATMPKTRAPFWRMKFERNVSRDQENLRALAGLGWRSRIVWECEIVTDANLQADWISLWLAGRQVLNAFVGPLTIRCSCRQ
jgi:DNA mismatch endonuclease, patch repair protein